MAGASRATTPVPRSSASTPSLRAREAVPARDPGGNVRVVVRVRGFLPREIVKNTDCLVRMDPVTQTTTLAAPRTAEVGSGEGLAGFAKAATRRATLEDRTFTFDKSFWSHDPDDDHYATQEDVYNSLGEEFLDHNFEGYHTCIFAYGQTGAGKSYTMMGTPSEPGLIPRTCEDLFQRIEAAQGESPNIAYNVRVSYFEVYNEHVRDLLAPPPSFSSRNGALQQQQAYLKIRESPTEGPYVKDLTEVPVRSLEEILGYMQMGDQSRTTAATKMNDTSSRSHAVFTILLRQMHHDAATDETTERSSRIRLVDLAGSERAKATEATGQRLREGSNINKSLTTLGRVIAALAEPPSSASSRRSKKSGTPGGSSGGGEQIVPYRDSILTWLLKDSLGGNSKTAMIACIAPGDYDETLSTLRYADQAKRIRTRAVVNQDSMSTAERDAQIAAMADEIRRLQLSVSDVARRREKDAMLQEEQLEEYQTRVTAMQRMMAEKALVDEGRIRSLQTENDALRLHLKLALDSLRNPIAVPPAAAVAAAAAAASSASRHRRSSAFGAPGSAPKGRRRSGRLGLSLGGDAGLEEQLGMDKEEGGGLERPRPEVLDEEAEPEETKREVPEPEVPEPEVPESIPESESPAGLEADRETDPEADSDPIDIFADKDDMEDYMQSLLADLSMFRRKIGDDKHRFLGLASHPGPRQPLAARVNV